MTSSARISAIAAFCSELRQAREYRRVTLREVVALTRISLHYVEAIEEGRWNDIPSAYVRGYLSLYANAVGMNRDKVIQSFDRLMMPETAAESAILDQAPPLLSEPQAVGITRAKIRTTWFALLSRNRKLLYLLSFLAVAGLLILLYISRQIEDRRVVSVVPFGEAVAENRTKLTDPLTVVPIAQAKMQDGTEENWIQWIGNSKGWLVVERDKDMPLHWHFDAYDTINIQYITSVSARVFPAGSAFAFHDGAKVPVGRVTAGDTAFYSVKPASTGHSDSTKNAVDSLVKG